jgi:SAM-dependent methyltransferase
VTLGDWLPDPLRRPAARLKNALRRRLRPGRVRELHLGGIGAGEFAAIGEEMLRLAIDPGGLQPGDRVLDVGCGLGRIAAPLARYLDASGSYLGFDVVEDAVWWCRRQFRTDPRFAFLHADVRSVMYNPRGRFAPEAFHFPLPDADCDFVIATSLFTHLLAPAVERYLAEAARVLRPGGRLFATFFVLDAAAEAGIAAGRAAYGFNHPAGPGRLEDPATPETAVGYPREWLETALLRAGFASGSPVHPGGWTGRGDGLSFQNLVIARRSPPGA